MEDQNVIVADQGEELEEVETTYPTTPDAEGWFYETEGDAALGMETRTEIDVRENENTFKRVALTNGRKCVLRELTRDEGKKAQQIAGVNAKTKDMDAAQGRLLAAYVAVGGTFYNKEGKELPYVMEDIIKFKMKDTNRLEAAASKLNF